MNEDFRKSFLGKEFCFLNVYKPPKITSFDVIHQLRRELNIKKIGHAGTLDPLADGVMQVGIGPAARLLDFLPSDKKYIATVKFGITSSTLDLEGEIIEAPAPKFSKEELESAVKLFIGEIEQIPPIYSAIKVNGKKLCDVARKAASKGKEADIKIPKRRVKIYDIKILNKNDTIDEIYNGLKLEVSCSKGTYIRTLADDIAKKLDTRACLTNLTRTQAGGFKIEDSIKINEANLEKNGVLPLFAIDLEKYELNEEEAKKVLNGISIPKRRDFNNDKEEVALFFENYLVSIAVLSDNKFKIKKVFKKSS